MPADTRVCLGSETFNNIDPTEYRSDATIMIGDPNTPDLAIVLECQLRPHRRKQYSWPVYLATLRARQECPVMLLVLCPDAKTAAACAEPIDTGHPDWVLKPLVLSPEYLPVVTDPAEARRLPGLTLLSAPLHLDGPDSGVVLAALSTALNELITTDPDHELLYDDYVASRLSAAHRRRLEEIMSTGTYEFKSDFARKYIGQGEVKAILAFLDARGLPVSDDVRSRITNCTDLERLEVWVRRAATVNSVEELFD
jgi:hypothetical protein